MAGEERVLAEMACFHSYYRFCQANQPDAPPESRYEAWLDYKEAVIRREGQRCSSCGQVRPVRDLEVRPTGRQAGGDKLAPDNVVCVCVSCGRSAGWLSGAKRVLRPD